ncbi:hypothetical protein Scep_002539 [Stephania cephalantha]|uniref:Uncharacterized protein n=1 Tax=Stephania cephalantha TaxID=152367 RepID=A0AAP0Q526_9MAGN
MAYYFKASTLFLVGLLLTGLLINASEALAADHASDKIAQTSNKEVAPVLATAPGRKLLQFNTLSPESELKAARFMAGARDFVVNAGNKVADVAKGAWNGMKKVAKSFWPF